MENALHVIYTYTLMKKHAHAYQILAPRIKSSEKMVSALISAQANISIILPHKFAQFNVALINQLTTP